MDFETSQVGLISSVQRTDRVSGVGLATMVAALHVVILASRIHARHPHRSPIALMNWQMPVASQIPATISDESPSNPHQAFCVGELALAAGMAIITLTRWLHVMRISGARIY